jgi:hypothetical protein
MDFDPILDTVRVLADTGQYLANDPDIAQVTRVFESVNPPRRLVEFAFSDNVPEGTMMQFFAIDSQADQLVTPELNGYRTIGALGVDTSDLVAFDIAANDNEAWATLTTTSTGLYRIDLTTGAATFVGAVGGGPLRGMTLWARGVPLIALRGGTELVRVFSGRPGTVLSTTTVRGLQPGETLVGLDWRSSNGLVYGVGSTSRVYVVDQMSGRATAVGPPFTPALSGTKFGVDVTGEDRLRVVSDTGQALRLNMDTGAVEPGSVPFSFAVAEIAVQRDAFGNVSSSTTFGIDVVFDRLRLQIMPVGTTFDVGPLGVDASAAVGFDISSLDNEGFAVLTVGGVPSLYRIDQRTGAATLLGALGGGGNITGLTAVPLAFYFAEGSTGAFFDTDFAMINPGPTYAPVIITYFAEDGRVLTQRVGPDSRTRDTVYVDANQRLGSTAFSATVSSPTGAPIVVERTMRWDATGYGMHTEHGVANLSPTWFFAEGAQGFYHTYFLLTNPSSVANTASVSFLLENGTVVQRSYPIPPRARRTIYTGDIPELVNRSFGTSVLFVNAPGAAERAMYFGSPTFNGGHESAGVTRPATDWFLAEGATGGFFTTFVLLANPGGLDANVTLTYLREGGGTITRTLVLPAASRRTVNVALEDTSLAQTSVATRVTSDAPIVVERAMYWPFDPGSWQEAHNAFGVTETARRWGLAEGRVGGPFGFQTFVLVANPGATAANLTVTFLRFSPGSALTRTFTVAAGGRLTITTGPGSMVPDLDSENFGIVIDSDQPVFAERALYSNANGVFWAAGSAATASTLP